MEDNEFWGNWRSYCHEMNRASGDTTRQVFELMKTQVASPFMTPEDVSQEAWAYAAELWKLDIAPPDLELLSQLGRVCTTIAHSSTVSAVDSGDWDYYYTNCNETEREDVTEEEGIEALTILSKSYWEDGPYQETNQGLVQKLQDELGLEYVPPDETLYNIFKGPMIAGDESSYDKKDLSGVVFTRGGKVWETGWTEDTEAEDLDF